MKDEAPMTNDQTVTQADAVLFLEQAFRNIALPPLDPADIEDIRDGLYQFGRRTAHSGEGRSNGAGEVTQAPLPVTAEDIAGIFDALEQWMRDNGDLPAGACGWREQMAEDPKSQATAEAFIRIVREHDNQSHSLPGDVASEADIALLGARMVLEGKATNATGALAKSDWGPSRAHIEGMRNTMREAIEYIDEARAALTPSALSGDAGECETCGGAGEVFGHADDCSNDSCALNGDMDSCNGKVEACHSCSADPEKFERLRSLSDRAAPAPWVVYSEPEVGLFASVFSGTVMQTGFAPVNLDDPANVEFIVEAANFLRAALPSHQGAGEP